MYMSTDGTPQIVLQDATERIRLELGLDAENRPGVILRGADERIRLSLTLDEDEYTCLRLRDQRDQLRACLYIAEDTPALNLYDNQEKIRACVTLEPAEDDTPYVLLLNKDEQRQMALTVPIDGSEGLLLQDREGADRNL